MCGIVARVDAEQRANAGGAASRADAPSPSTSRALALLEERGPDGTATWRDGALELGLARLAIVAPREPPRVHERGDVAVVMNGELYEHRAMRAALGVDEGTSDQALVPALFERGGAAAVLGARGPATCAITDRRARSITLVRDRFGKRPLFVDVVAGASGSVSAASEVKALVAARASPVRFAGAAVARFLARGILEDDAPLVAGIESVPAGASWVLHEDGRVVRNARAALDVTAARALDVELLRAACARRIDGLEVPAAVLLSGGLDSSVIAALCASRVGVAYTMRIRSSDTSDESDKARAMADALGLELRVVDVAPPAFADLAACAWRLEAPDAFVNFGVAHAYATLARRLRADGIRVVVTGEGADELFMGYHWQRAQAAAQNGWPFPGADVTERAWAGASLALPRTSRALEVLLRARFGAPLGARNPMSLVNGEALGDAEVAPSLGVEGRGAEHRRAESLRVDMPMWPLRIADRILLGHGVEPRAPFLDEDVVSAALALPASAHESPNVDKPLLRALAREALPAHAPAPAPKQGFAAWSWPGAAPTRAWAARLADEGTVLARADALHELARGDDDASALLAWRLVVLEVTARQLDAARGGAPWRP